MALERLRNALEAALLTAGRPLGLDQLLGLFEGLPDPVGEEVGEPGITVRPTLDQVRAALDRLRADYGDRGIELKEVASGYRIQVRPEYGEALGRLFAERPARYSRALLETLALIAYRQPITRGEVEEVRGVAVSSTLIRTLLEREWVRVVGHRDVPGRPAMFGTTRQFLDYFNLKSLADLPSLAQLKEIDALTPDLFPDPVRTGRGTDGDGTVAAAPPDPAGTADGMSGHA
jgi:segregation and condensation protein B